MATRNNKWSGKKFSKALMAFCENNNLVLNPEEACNSSDNRIIRWTESGSKEHYYIQVPGTPLNIDNIISPDFENVESKLLF